MMPEKMGLGASCSCVSSWPRGCLAGMRIATGFADHETIAPQSPQYTKTPSTPPIRLHSKRNIDLAAVGATRGYWSCGHETSFCNMTRTKREAAIAASAPCGPKTWRTIPQPPLLHGDRDCYPGRRLLGWPAPCSRPKSVEKVRGPCSLPCRPEAAASSNAAPPLAVSRPYPLASLPPLAAHDEPSKVAPHRRTAHQSRRVLRALHWPNVSMLSTASATSRWPASL